MVSTIFFRFPFDYLQSFRFPFYQRVVFIFVENGSKHLWWLSDLSWRLSNSCQRFSSSHWDDSIVPNKCPDYKKGRKSAIVCSNPTSIQHGFHNRCFETIAKSKLKAFSFLVGWSISSQNENVIIHGPMVKRNRILSLKNRHASQIDFIQSIHALILSELHYLL